MYLNISPRDHGRVYLSINKSYRDKETKKTRNKVIESIGYVDELVFDYPDPVAHFKEVARKMTEDEKSKRRIPIEVDMDEELTEGAEGTKNLGYALPLKIYHSLGLDKFISSKARSEKFKFNTNSIMILLVISRILSPGSKLKAYAEKGRYFERFDFSIDDVYRALTHFDKISGELQRYLYESVRTSYGSDTSIIYYDVTNYYFEIKKPDDLRKYGKAKQNRKKPITQMGLAMDADGIPMHYELFPGNKLDKETFRSVIGEIRKNYDTGRIVVVADMGVITGDNINYLVGDKPENPQNGYVFSFSVRGGTKAFKAYVLSDDGYTDENGKPFSEGTDFKIKSRVIAREINVTMSNGKTKTKIVYEKQIVFWSRKYYLKARAERAEILDKAEALIADPKKFNKATSYGAASYVNNLEYDKETGEVLDSGKLLCLDTAKIETEEKYDGYYAIVTSELKMPDSEIIDTYRGLWEIEETFKITKDDLESRPVYVSDYAHINAHFLTCFIALTILRLIQKKTGKKYSAAKIIECMNKIECMNEHANIYMFAYRSALSSALSDTFGIDFSKKRLRLADIKKILGDVKK
jgi:transposase